MDERTRSVLSVYRYFRQGRQQRLRKAKAPERWSEHLEISRECVDLISSGLLPP